MLGMLENVALIERDGEGQDTIRDGVNSSRGEILPHIF
jgi:hypothetical protein